MNRLDRILEKAAYIAIFSTPFIPLVVSDWLIFDFITGKNFLFRAIVEFAFSIWVVIAVRNQQFRPRKGLVLGALLLFIGIVGVANFLGAHPYKSFWSSYQRMEGYVTLLHLLAFFFVITSLIRTDQLWERLFQTSLLASAVVTGYGLLQLAGLFQPVARVDATLGNPTYLAGYLLFHVFFAAFLFSRTENRLLRYLYGLLVIFQIVVLYYTATRGAILGLGVGVVAAALLVAMSSKQERRNRYLAGVTAAAVILVGISLMLMRDSSIVRESPTLSRFASFSFGAGNPRVLVWRVAWQGVAEHPLIGWGQENFNYVFNKYYDPALYSEEPWYDRVHNVFLEWLVAAGVSGLIAYLLLYGAALYLVWRKHERNDIPLLTKAILSGLFATYLVHNFFVFDNITSYINFILVLGYLHYRFPGAKIESLVVFDRGVVSRTAVVLVAVGIAVSGFYFSVAGPALASQLLFQAMRVQPGGPSANLHLIRRALAYETFGNSEIRSFLQQSTVEALSSNAPNDVKREWLTFARRELEKEIVVTPRDARYQLELGSMLRRAGLDQDALPNLERAATLSPTNQVILTELAAVYLNLGRLEDGLSVLERAFRLEESNSNARLQFAIANILAGKSERAAELLAPLQGTPYEYHPSLVRAYAMTGKKDSALKLARLAVEANPRDGQARSVLASIYLALGRRAEAVVEIRKTMELDPVFTAQGEALIKSIESSRIP